MSFEYKSSYIIVIPTGNKKEKPEVGKWEGNSSPLFYPIPPFSPVSILTVIILSIRSKGCPVILGVIDSYQYP